MITRSKRFWDKIRNDKIRKINMRGTSFTLFKNMKMPTHEQMNEMDKYGLIYDIDQEIRDAVIDLNKHGFKTAGSCAGHVPNKNAGFISIMGIPTEQKIQTAKSILSKHGLKNLRLIKYDNFWSFSFKSVGIHSFRSIYKFDPKTHEIKIRNSKHTRK
jgi:hypothetical protein